MRKCRNWQTSKTKDLVVGTPCGFKSHLPQLREQKCSLFLCALAIRHARTNMGTDAESSLSCGCTHGWSHTADAATVPSREAAQGLVGMANCFIPLSAWRIASYNSSNAEKSCRICDSFFFVEPTGLEPMTSRTSSGRSSQLSYGSILRFLRKGQWNRRGSNP